MRNASSNEGEYLLLSMAIIVWRVTPTFSASSCWVISPWLKRCFRIVLLTRHSPILEPPAIQVELGKFVDDRRDQARVNHCNEHDVEGQIEYQRDHGENHADGKGIKGISRTFKFDQFIPLVRK